MSRGRSRAGSTRLGGGRAQDDAATEPLLGDGDVPRAIIQSWSWGDSQWEVRPPKRVLLRVFLTLKSKTL